MLDKNTIIGLVLIFAVFIGYGILTSPSEQEREAMKIKQDSLREVQQKINLENNEKQIINSTSQINSDSSIVNQDSIRLSEFGAFASCSQGTKDTISISNELFEIKFSSKGAIVEHVTLKNYLSYDKKPVELFDKNSYGLNLTVGQNIVRTEDLYFEPTINNKPITKSISLNPQDSVVLVFRAKVSDSLNSGYLEFRYIIRGNDYRVGYNVVFNNLKGIVSDQSSIEMVWNSDLRVQEKDASVEVKNSSIYYLLKDEVDYLKENGSDDKQDENGIPIKWVSYKQQFFSTAIIANNAPFSSATMQTITDSRPAKDTTYLRSMKSLLTIPFDGELPKSEISMDFYYGPNKYAIISDYNIDMEEIIPLGWGFFLLQWVNRFAIIPIFDFLSQFGWNMGIVILILTILVKIVLFPLAYKSYSSSAKMRVIQPETKIISEKYPKPEQAMEKQKATMALYKRAGINPMAGCLPMLLQFPILVAMFRFFPASIELRQQSFLWADDLSSYDSILTLPFEIPFYGSNVSLFCLLMTVAQLFYTRMTMKQQAGTTQMPGMKYMMYLMPVMMLFVLNQYSSALNYYYFISLCFTFIQVWIIGKTINEQKVLDKLKANQNKPIKKSKWQERIEALEKQNRTIIDQRQKQQGKRK
ncbi:MAG: membrane protein insertase YidC [Bacteroidales bacterium]|nr:membrane protein insertase YidC [Bacteroidales bacterium]MDD4529098.1 membrane protein insertase YidC [Bacteroidales bacterium]MDD4830009.1 membrane protein insertase YidC [Bacteroidales bacterium]